MLRIGSTRAEERAYDGAAAIAALRRAQRIAEAIERADEAVRHARVVIAALDAEVEVDRIVMERGPGA